MPPNDAATRPLLPRAEPLQKHQTSAVRSITRKQNTYGLPRKRVCIKAACERCREKKTKCDGHRPKCHLCRRHGLDCIYKVAPSETYMEALKKDNSRLQRRLDVLEASQSTLGRIYSILQSLPDPQAAAILRRIRTGTDPASILRHMEDGDLLLQLRPRPETRYRFEFPWRKQMPLFLQRLDNPYLGSRVYEGTFSDSRARYEARCPQYCVPFEAAELIEPRLDDVSPSSWTLVSDNDGLMRVIIRAYFKYEYSWVTAFHMGDFLDDMNTGATNFCSSLLVNAVLALGCHCYPAIPHRSEFWDPESLGYRFAAETKRLWELEQYTEASLPTVQAAMILSALYVNYGLDELADAYTVQGVAMAEQLDLFAPPSLVQSRREQRSRSLTAWSLFWLQSTKAYHFMDAPLLETPPKQPLPDPADDPEWYGELWVRYPLNEALIPSQHPFTFKAKVEFNVHLNDMACLRSKKIDDPGRQQFGPTSPDFSDFTAKLCSWYTSLPAQLSATEIVFPSQFKIHMHYQYVMGQLQDILIPGGTGSCCRMPRQVATLSIPGLPSPGVCLETLIRLHYLRHGFEGADMTCAVWLQLVAFSAIQQLRRIATEKERPAPTPAFSAPASSPIIDELRSSLILVAKALYDQGRNYHLAASVFELVHGSMSEQDRLVLSGIVPLESDDVGVAVGGKGRGDGDGDNARRGAVGDNAKRRANQKIAMLTRSRHPIDFKPLTDDPGSQRLGQLLQGMLP